MIIAPTNNSTVRMFICFAIKVLWYLLSKEFRLNWFKLPRPRFIERRGFLLFFFWDSFLLFFFSLFLNGNGNLPSTAMTKKKWTWCASSTEGLPKEEGKFRKKKVKTIFLQGNEEKIINKTTRDLHGVPIDHGASHLFASLPPKQNWDSDPPRSVDRACDAAQL